MIFIRQSCSGLSTPWRRPGLSLTCGTEENLLHTVAFFILGGWCSKMISAPAVRKFCTGEGVHFQDTFDIFRRHKREWPTSNLNLGRSTPIHVPPVHCIPEQSMILSCPSRLCLPCRHLQDRRYDIFWSQNHQNTRHLLEPQFMTCGTWMNCFNFGHFSFILKLPKTQAKASPHVCRM